jgi:hypothetical protein
MNPSDLPLWLGGSSSPDLMEAAILLLSQEKKERLLKDHEADTGYCYSFPGLDRL